MRLPKSAWAVIVVFAAFLTGLMIQSGAASKVIALLPESGYSKQQRADAEWYRYRAEQECKITDTRTESRSTTTYVLVGKSFMPSTSYSTVTLYEWTCRGGDVHWTR